MSAPLVVNTKDGGCWTRRTVTEGGVALYALADVCKCPEFVMATLAELAERGIVGSADVLPMPVGPEPQVAGASQRAEVAKLIGDAKPASTAFVVSLAEAVRDVREHEHPKWEDLYCQNLLMWLGERTGPVLRCLLDSEARVAELEAERHTTNEALSDAAEQLRANADRIAELEALTPAPIQTCRKCGAGYTYGEPCSTCAFKARMAAEVDGITVRIAPTQALSLEDPHDSPLHHAYKIPHDLPPIGGAPC